MNLGDAFYFVADIHLWIVISHPSHDRRVVIVSVTTKEPYKDSTCELHPGDHPKITHDSIVYYKKAMLLPIDVIQKVMAPGRVPPVSSDVLARIHDGAGLTRFMESDCKDLLEEQGLIVSS